MNEQQRYSLDELASLTGLTRRTVRYYIQEGLVDRPIGAGRGAHYTPAHLEQLLEVRRWQQAGVSLEKIRDLRAPDAALSALAARPVPGSVEVRSHVIVADGVELVVDAGRAGLDPAQLRKFTAGVIALAAQITGASPADQPARETNGAAGEAAAEEDPE
jgi:DNA-binding transcriptional MerR regulator